MNEVELPTDDCATESYINGETRDTSSVLSVFDLCDPETLYLPPPLIPNWDPSSIPTLLDLCDPETLLLPQPMIPTVVMHERMGEAQPPTEADREIADSLHDVAERNDTGKTIYSTFLELVQTQRQENQKEGILIVMTLLGNVQLTRGTKYKYNHDKNPGQRCGTSLLQYVEMKCSGNPLSWYVRRKRVRFRLY